MFHRITFEAGKLHNTQFFNPGIAVTAPTRPQDHDESQSPHEVQHYNNLSFKPRQSETTGNRIKKFLKNNYLPLSFVIYLLVGTLFYSLNPGNGEDLGGWVVAYFEAISIGFSVGLTPKNPAYLPNPWFSSCYILVGAGLIAVNFFVLSGKISDKASKGLFDGLKRREDYEERMSRENPLSSRVAAYIKFNLVYLIIILLWVLWVGFIVAWSIIATNELNEMDPEKDWGIAYATYFAISLCSSAGAFSLPPSSPVWSFGLAGISMMIGVPLMALAVSCIVIMLSQGHNFKKLKKAAWEPIRFHEMDSIRQLGLVDAEGSGISKGGFVLLGLLRMGQDGGFIRYLADAYDSMDLGEGVLVGHDSRPLHLVSSRARAYLESGRSISDSLEKDDSRPKISKEDKGWSAEALISEKSQNSLGIGDPLIISK